MQLHMDGVLVANVTNASDLNIEDVILMPASAAQTAGFLSA
jgi:hypothetical protein